MNPEIEKINRDLRTLSENKKYIEVLFTPTRLKLFAEYEKISAKKDESHQKY